MTFDEAREQLGFHCGRDLRIDDPRWRNGILATLRPYAGLRRDAMTNVDRCVDIVADHLRHAATLDRGVMNSLWGIVHLTRAWALHPDGMLKQNGLITEEDAHTLEEWVDALSYRVMMLLDDCDDPEHNP